MYVELTKLLAEQQIIHPTTLDAANWSTDGLRLTIGGYPWWQTPHPDWDARSSIHFVFTDVLEGSIRPDEFDFASDEILEDFDVVPINEIGWAQPSDAEIYCSGPVPDPLSLYVRLNDFLREECAFKLPCDFLNGAEQISSFIRLTQSRNFLLGRGPECIRDLLRDELKTQGVAHNEIFVPHQSIPTFLVRFGSSAFICKDARAELDRHP